jgi:outer membrane lipoprotein SlyB
MRLTIISIAALGLLGSVATAQAGCITGAIVGGVAGHMVGHGKVGAAAGCAVGHHKAAKDKQQQAPAK